MRSVGSKLVKLTYLPILVLSIIAAGCQKEIDAPGEYRITCYAASYGKGIYKSENGGTSWFPVDVDQQALYAYYKRLYLSPHDQSLLYITTTGAGLFELNLHTGALERVNRFKNKNMRSIAFRGVASSLDTRGEMLVGMGGGGVGKTVPGSGTWQLRNKGLTYRHINVLFSHDEAVYAGTVKGLFKWDESSEQWLPASRGIRNKNILSLAAGPQGKTLYAGSGAYEGEKGRFEDIPSLYLSTDQGLTWTASDNGIPDGTLAYAIAVNPKRAQRIYLGTSRGVYRSTNNGKTWEKMTKGLPKGLKVFDVKMAHMEDGEDAVYAVGSKGVFMTIDVDEPVWTGKNYGLEPTAMTSIVLLPQT